MVTVDYFSDLLCIWAYGGQVRIDELKKHFAGKIRLRYHFISIFASAHKQIEQNWKERDGFDGFNQHLQTVAGSWPHVACSSQLWQSCRPASSTPSHLVLKAVGLLEQQGRIDADPLDEFAGRSRCEMLMWRMREAFFRDNRDIAHMDILAELTEAIGIDWSAVMSLINSGEAFAGLFDDEKLRQQYCLQGSPSYVLNEGRQVLYGNVGYRIIEANVEELLHREQGVDGASWC
jgi:predicted DsbA family dithiol-disulfide isomerase